VRPRLFSPSSPLRVKGLKQRLADEIDQHDHQHQHREGGEGEPPGFDIALGLAQQLAQTRRRARYTEVERVQAGQA